MCGRAVQMPKIKGFYRLSDGRLDGKGAREYQRDLSRGDLSRPACSHVKQVAKQAGDSVIPACGIFPGRFFCGHFLRASPGGGHAGGHMSEVTKPASSAARYRPETRLVHACSLRSEFGET